MSIFPKWEFSTSSLTVDLATPSRSAISCCVHPNCERCRHRINRPGICGVSADRGLTNTLFLCDRVGSLLPFVFSASEERSGFVRNKVLIMSTLF